MQIEGVKFINVRGSSRSETGINVQCSKLKPCQNVEFSRVDLTFNGKNPTANCSNVDVRFQESNPSCSKLLTRSLRGLIGL